MLMRNFTHSTKLSSPASGGETPRRYAAWTTEKRNYAAAISGSNALSDTPPFPAILQKTKRPRYCGNSAEGKTSKRGHSWMHKDLTHRLGKVSTPGIGAFPSSSTAESLPRSCTGSKASVPAARWRNFSKNGRDEIFLNRLHGG